MQHQPSSLPEFDITGSRRPRSQDRARTFLKALIEFNNGAAKLDCTVKNVSPTGARINIAASVSLPSEFDLHIPHRGEIMRSQLMWREKDAIGVRFVAVAPSQSGPAATTTHLPLAERPRADIEAENMRLRKRVKDLSLRLEKLGQDPNVDEMP